MLVSQRPASDLNEGIPPVFRSEEEIIPMLRDNSWCLCVTETVRVAIGQRIGQTEEVLCDELIVKTEWMILM